MERVTQVEPRPDYKLWLKYGDGSEGVVDLRHLVGQGVFSSWTDPSVFKTVRVSDHGAPEWPGGVDLCPDALYMEITGKTLADLSSKPLSAASA